MGQRLRCTTRDVKPDPRMRDLALEASYAVVTMAVMFALAIAMANYMQ